MDISRLLLKNMDEILKYAIENGIIDLSYVQEKIDMNKRKELLEKHPYEIWKGKDGRYYTYIPDQEEGRKLRSRKKISEIQDVICDYWKEELYNPTVEDIYNEWIFGKLEREEITITTKNRYDRQYKESMVDFGKRRIKTIEEYDIEKFSLQAIHEHKMTAKGFSNLRTIILGIFKLAKKKKLVSFSITSVMSDIDISKKSFRKIKRSDDQLVFMDDEMKKMDRYFSSKELDVKDLGILLLFKTGLRPGELVGLEWDNINGNVIHVQNTEIRYENDDKKYIYEVRGYPKTEAGIRDVVLPQNALWILDELKEKNPNGKYVLEVNGVRIRGVLIDDRIRAICKKVGITEKSPNKIRKTYATMLIDNNVDESLVISQMGHTDIATTKTYYYKNRKSLNQKAKIIDSVFSQTMLIRSNQI